MNDWMLRLLSEYALPLGSHPRDNVCLHHNNLDPVNEDLLENRQTAFSRGDLRTLLSGPPCYLPMPPLTSEATT